MYAKTPLAWEALARRDLLDHRAHTLLLMANGRRTLRELARLLDQDVADLALTLVEQGYLQDCLPTALVEADEEAIG